MPNFWPIFERPYLQNLGLHNFEFLIKNIRKQLAIQSNDTTKFFLAQGASAEIAFWKNANSL